MARTIRVADIGDYCTQQMERLLRASVLETDNLLKQASPVDTGRFRASWQVGENTAVAPPDYSGDVGGKDANIPPISKVNYQDEKLGNVYSVHNNLPYAEPLANGSSRQAPAGWVQGVAKDVQGRVRVAAARIARES